jgi:signal transduction histidine kinase
VPELPGFLKTRAFKFALIYAGLFAASVTLIFLYIYWSTVGYLERQTTATIEAEIQGLAEQFNRRGLRGLVDVVAERVRNDEDGRTVYLFADENLRPLAGNLDRWPAGLNSTDGWVNFRRRGADGDVAVRARVLRISPRLTLLVGRDIRELQNIRAVFERTALLGIAATLLVALAGGMLLGISAHRRIADINRATRRIVAGDLKERIPQGGGKDEYDELVANLNAMFDQISRLIDSMRNVGDGIAHDLRTPLTRLRSRIESLTMKGSADAAELRDCLAEADRLLGTFTAILRIARVQSGAYRSAMKYIDIGALASDVADLYRAVADEQGTRLVCDIEIPAEAVADRELVAQALTNMLDNALKYGGKGGDVTLTVSTTPTVVRLSVADQGPGIPAADRERVLERFVRLDAARDKPGNGLGLPLVRAVADQHQGHLVLEDNAPGLVVTLELQREPIDATGRRESAEAA